MAGPQRKKNEDALLLALACGATVEAAAKQCALSERTVYRRMEDTDFRSKLREVRGDMVRRAAGMLTAGSAAALTHPVNCAWSRGPAGRPSMMSG